MAGWLVPLDSGSPIALDKAIILIGRHPDCDVVLTDSRKISRRHCCIAQVDSSYVIRDLGSMNGVRVNGAGVRESRMQENDEVHIGDVRFRFSARATPAKRPAPQPAPKAAAAPPRPAAPPVRPPLELSQDFPVAIPDELGFPLEVLSRETPQQDPLRNAQLFHPVEPVMELDSGEIELRALSDSGVGA